MQRPATRIGPPSPSFSPCTAVGDLAEPAGQYRCVDPVLAAITVAGRFGLVADQPSVLADSNNVVVWLAPLPVVAKVGTGHHRRLGHELAVARHLAAVGAPVVPPTTRVPVVVHRCGGFQMTFWDYHPRVERPIAPGDLAQALFDLHDALAGYRGEVPSYLGELEAVRGVLTNPLSVPALAEADRGLLLRRLDSVLAVLEGRRSADRVLHGSPHDSNVIVVAGDPRFIDFETVCVGPVEWDLVHAGTEVAGAYPGSLDEEALRWCSALVSVKTAAWCWAKVDHPGMRWHAEHHLALARKFVV